jgi:MFS family permease
MKKRLIQLKEHIAFSIPSSIWYLGIVSLFINLSSIIIFTISPFYLTKVLGVTAIGLGFIEGGVELTAWLSRIFSGVFSDYIGKRKPLLTFAYGLISLSRILFVLAPNFTWFYFARSLDRLGNGIQATPREALVGDLSPRHLKGACYGLRQSLSVAGSLLGAIILVFFMIEGEENYKLIFWIAGVPPFLALIILALAIRDVVIPHARQREMLFSSLKNVLFLKSAYWRVVGVACIFALSNYSGAFLLLHAKDVGVTVSLLPLVMVFQNLASMVSAYPVGRLSDKLDRRLLLAVGFMMVIISGFFLAYASGLTGVLIGAAFWGFHIGITQSLLMAKIADTTVCENRGVGFGIYYVLIGSMLFVSNSGMGWIWHHINPSVAFLASSALAGLALFTLPLIKSIKKASSNSQRVPLA